MYVYVCIYIYVYVYIYIHIHIYIYVCIYEMKCYASLCIRIGSTGASVCVHKHPYASICVRYRLLRNV